MSERIVNPAYLSASHVVLLDLPGVPSLEEQIQRDIEVQKQLEQEEAE